MPRVFPDETCASWTSPTSRHRLQERRRLRRRAATDAPTHQGESDDVAPDRLRSLLLGALSTIAVLLAAIGVYGVIADAVVERTREIGIRAALGASRPRLLALVVRQTIATVGWGLAVGIGLALAATRALKTFLMGVAPSDPTTMAAVAAGLTCVALIACYLPGRRAASIDPVTALKAE